MVVTTYAEGAFGILSGSPYACLDELRAQGIYNSGKVVGFTQCNDNSVKDIMVMYWRGSRKILSNLINWFKFSETSGTTSYDEGDGANNVSLISGAAFTTGMDSTISGVGALFLSGSLGTAYNVSGHCTVPANATLVNGIGSVSLWVKTLATGIDQTIFEIVPYSDFDGVLSLGAYFRLFIDALNKPSFEFMNYTPVTTYNADHINVSGASAITLDSWTHIGATSDGSTTRLYVNGSEQGVGSTSGVNVGQWVADLVMSGGTSSHVRNIGYHTISGTIGSYFSGSIDNVRLTNSVFNSEEMMQLYDARL